jgi:hypothetical protein
MSISSATSASFSPAAQISQPTSTPRSTVISDNSSQVTKQAAPTETGGTTGHLNIKA